MPPISVEAQLRDASHAERFRGLGVLTPKQKAKFWIKCGLSLEEIAERLGTTKFGVLRTLGL